MDIEHGTSVQKRIKEIRQGLKLNQADFAHSLTMSDQELSMLESGETNPGLDFFLKVSTIHGISLDFLIKGVGDMFLTSPDKPVAPVGEIEFINQMESIEDVLWLMRHSPMFESSLMGWAGGFFHDNRVVLEENVKYFKKKEKNHES